MKQTQKIKQIPPYIFAQIDEKKAEAQAQGIDVIDLGIGDPDLPTPDFIIDAMADAIRKPSNHNYPPYQGTLPFREAVANWYKKRFSVELDAKTEVLSLIGSKEGIAHSFLAFLDPGDIALLPDPGYPAYKVGALLAGGEPYMIPVDEAHNYEPDLDSIPSEVVEKSRMLFLNYPSNPTGTVASDAFLEKAIAWCTKNEVLLCMDLAYSEVYFEGKKPKSILEFEGAKDIAIEFHTLSKTFNMTGWRVGMAVGNAEAIKYLGTIKTNMDSGVFKAIQETAIVALYEGDEFIDKQNQLLQERRDIIVDGLNELGWQLEKPSSTYYIWAPIPKGWKSQDFAIALLEKAGVLVVPGTGYGEYGEGYFRISITTKTARLTEAMERLKEKGLTLSALEGKEGVINA